MAIKQGIINIRNDTNTEFEQIYPATKGAIVELDTAGVNEDTSVQAHVDSIVRHITPGERVAWNGKVNITDVINSLTSSETGKPLSANQGRVLKLMIDNQEFARAYNTIEDMVDALNNDEITVSHFRVGFNLLIIDLDVPDFWVTEIEGGFSEYTYTTDEQLLTDIRNSPDSTLQIGYCRITLLETQKVDLTNYVQKSFTIAGLSLNANITKEALQGAIDFNSKVDKVEGKQLSTNDYTTPEKTKLSGIATGATANATDAALRERSSHTGTQAISTVDGLQTALNNKVDKVTGMGLSTNDYTTPEKTKLSGIAEGATANATDAQLRARSSHTGTQAISTVTGLQTALDAKVPTSEVTNYTSPNTIVRRTATSGIEISGAGGIAFQSSSDSPEVLRIHSDDGTGNDDVLEVLNPQYNYYIPFRTSSLILRSHHTDDSPIVVNKAKALAWDNKSTLALGETSTTAYRGDRGKTAYDHAGASGNPHSTSFAQITSKPTTIAGYGITDAQRKVTVSASEPASPQAGDIWFKVT